MKKTLAIILVISLLVSSCCFAVFAWDNTDNSKIREINGMYTNAGSDDILYVGVYYNTACMSQDEKENIIYERCGFRESDFEISREEYLALTNEQRKARSENIKLYQAAQSQLEKELGLNAIKPMLDYLGIQLSKVNDNYYYHDALVVLSETDAVLDLTKSEIIKASELDYVKAINCYDTNYNPEDPTEYQNGTIEPGYDEPETTANSTEEQIPTDGGPEYSEIMRKKVNEASIYSNIESDKIELQIKDTKEGMIYAEDFNEKDGKKLLEDFKDYGVTSVESCYLDFTYYRAFVTLDKKDRKNVIDTCLKLFDNPIIIAATPVSTKEDLRFEKGDVNADEVLDILDAVYIQKFSVDKIEFRDEQKSYGDYNNDGICDVLDAIEIQKALVEK